MEASSPLAFFQPNHPTHFPSRQDGPKSHLANCYSYAPAPVNFNFRDMSMLKSKSDYFSFNPVRGSSPTASLAADLSQNFHIDQSPQLPTPRKNLFNGCSGRASQHEAITPPVPSSSPGPEGHSMEFSPLPHKPSFTLQQMQQPTVAIGLPTPDPTPVEDVSMQSCLPLAPAVVPRTQPYHQRRISNPARPSLRKGLSMTAVSSHPSSNSSLASFPFGTTSSQQPKLLESFADSPPSARKGPIEEEAASVMPPLPRLSFPDDGSPVGPLRRPGSSRPRLACRRTQSLQGGLPARPMRQDKRCCTEGSLRLGEEEPDLPTLSLPFFKPQDEVEPLPRIEQQTLLDMLQGLHDDKLDSYKIIDCRFEYEYDGGHIDGAINFNDKERLAQLLFPSGHGSIASEDKTSALIFHCEYSNHRAPVMARFIRHRDRMANKDRYPYLSYPEIYILEGGYSGFFRSHREYCVPQAYVEMEAKEHEDACERGMAKVKRRAKLSRAQTYAFGQALPSLPAVQHTGPLMPPPKPLSVPLPCRPFDPPLISPPLATAPLQRSFGSPMNEDAMDIDLSSPCSFESPIFRRTDSM